MAFATIEDVRNFTSFSEVSDLSEEKITKYIEFANAYIRRKTGFDYSNATDPYLLTNLERATVLLVEYLWFNDQPEIKEAKMSGVESEKIGTYSYNLSNGGDSTGNAELDELLESLTPKYGLNLFSVSKPSRVRAMPFSPHAWVSDHEN